MLRGVRSSVWGRGDRGTLSTMKTSKHYKLQSTCLTSHFNIKLIHSDIREHRNSDIMGNNVSADEDLKKLNGGFNYQVIICLFLAWYGSDRFIYLISLPPWYHQVAMANRLFSEDGPSSELPCMDCLRVEMGDKGCYNGEIEYIDIKLLQWLLDLVD